MYFLTFYDKEFFRSSDISFTDIFPVHHRYIYYFAGVKLITNDGPLTSVYICYKEKQATSHTCIANVAIIIPYTLIQTGIHVKLTIKKDI